MSDNDPASERKPAKDAHKALGLWSMRRTLTFAFTGAAGLLIAAWFFVSWLLGSPPHEKPKPLDVTAQLDLLKLVFALVAGVGALVALITAYRRQRVDEAAAERAEHIQAHAEKIARQSHERAEREAERAVHDAAERRVTDLYGQAVEQLGHDKAAVRLGGLYSLERLAQDHPQHRQTIVNVLCAYLRMPFGQASRARHLLANTDDENAWRRDAAHLLTSDNNATESQNIQQEIEVRQAAQNILRNHLRRYDSRQEELDTYWEDVLVNLSGAILFGFSLAGCELTNLECSQATFLGTSWFDEAKFRGEVSFRDAIFQRLARFYGADFEDAYFYRAKFCAYAGFRGAKFHQQCRFVDVHFRERSTFEGATFGGAVDFSEVTFADKCSMEGARITPSSPSHVLPSSWIVDQPEGLIKIIDHP
ncbi:pentapeptide repeat-containing protein [Spirillospora sp. NPDC127200]